MLLAKSSYIIVEICDNEGVCVMINNKDKDFIIFNANDFNLTQLSLYFKGEYTEKQLKNFCDRNEIKYKKKNKGERKKRTLNKQMIRTPINHDYFKTWSRNMAYIFGLWCADGNIGNNGGWQFSIKLHKNDKYLLQQVLDEMQSEHKIYDRKDNSCEFIIGSKTIYNDIVNLGGEERKSLSLKFPHIPHEYMSDFIRGYFDGDGSIRKTNGHQVNICGTKEFLNDLKIILNNELNLTKITIYEHHPEIESNTYKLYLHRKGDVKKFQEYIYGSLIENTLYMKRKYI